VSPKRVSFREHPIKYDIVIRFLNIWYVESHQLWWSGTLYNLYSSQIPSLYDLLLWLERVILVNMSRNIEGLSFSIPVNNNSSKPRSYFVEKLLCTLWTWGALSRNRMCWIIGLFVRIKKSIGMEAFSWPKVDDLIPRLLDWSSSRSSSSLPWIFGSISAIFQVF
jgi:hypothetical protein